MDDAGARNDDLILVKSENSTGIAEGEFMKDFNYREDRHGEKNHFRIKRSAEDFLELRKTGYKNKILALKYTLNIGGDEIDCITIQDG